MTYVSKGKAHPILSKNPDHYCDRSLFKTPDLDSVKIIYLDLTKSSAIQKEKYKDKEKV